MANKKSRTYELKPSTVDWIDKFAKENDANKKDVVERAIRVYAAKMQKGDWRDPKFKSSIDKQFERL